MSDALDSTGVVTAPVPYVCRVCTSSTPVYVPVDTDGPEPTANPPRLWRGRCDECEGDVVHVVEFALSGGGAGA